MTHRLARLLLASVLTVGLLATPSGAAFAGSGGVDAPAEVVSGDLVNQERTARSLNSLETNLQLVRVAREHSARMAADDDRGGRCGDGSTLRHRSPLDAGITQAWTNLRENVACGPDAETLHRMLMDSPGHRANILADDVEFIGVGAVRSADGTLWLTQIFMRGGDRAPIAAIEEGLKASQLTFPSADSADFAVLSRADVFADSLGGAALAAGQAPVLFTDAPSATEPNPGLRPSVRVELDRVLAPGSTVYVLGGTAAVSQSVENELRSAGYTVRRLFGPDRFATATAIAREVVARHGTPDKVAIAYGYNWPDAVTGGAAAGRNGFPVVLVQKDAIPAATRDFLATVPGAARVVLGGSAVVSEGLVSELDADRIAGQTRTGTALGVATDLFGAPGSDVVVLHGWDEHSWARALAMSSYSVRKGAPQLLVANTTPEDTRAWLAGKKLHPVFGAAVPHPVREDVRSVSGV